MCRLPLRGAVWNIKVRFFGGTMDGEHITRTKRHDKQQKTCTLLSVGMRAKPCWMKKYEKKWPKMDDA